MKRHIRLAAAAGVAVTAAALMPGVSHAATLHGWHAAGRSGAVFVQTDAVAGNAVVAYD
jgi:hypothetical protein